MKYYGDIRMQQNTRKRPTSGIMGANVDFLGFE